MLATDTALFNPSSPPYSTDITSSRWARVGSPSIIRSIHEAKQNSHPRRPFTATIIKIAVMHVPHHRHSALGSRQLLAPEPSIESNRAMGDQLWVVDEAYEWPEKGTESPLKTTCKMPSKKNTQQQLRINTYSKVDPHDRYMSSEEEPSPSTYSDTDNEEELKQEVLEQMVNTTIEPIAADEYEAEIAVAVPIITMRPKLVDIINLAPMHKRKRRTEKSALPRSGSKNAALRIPTFIDGIQVLVAEATKAATPEERLLTRKDNFCSLAPDSWLPDENVHIVQEEEEEDEHCFPNLELRKAPTYHDYDPYSLRPPRLSPRNLYNTTSKQPGSVARARKNSNPPINMNSGWKGLTRSMILAKNQTIHRADHQIFKKPKMIARAADEREEPLVIPAFPFGDVRDVD